MAGVSKVANYFQVNIKRDEDFKALPGFHLVNQGVGLIKEEINSGEGGCSGCLKKAGAYLGFRVISYSCIPIVANLASLIISCVLTILSLPTLLCGDGLFRWCWTHTQGSFGYLMESLFDFTCDFRQVTGRVCCCAEESLYLAI